jgi:hypothetical protein
VDMEGQQKSPKLLEQVRNVLRLQYYSIHTVRSYIDWIKHPGAARDWSWQYLFPAREVSTDPRSGVVRCHHVDPAVVNKAIKVAARRVGRDHNIGHPTSNIQHRRPNSQEGEVGVAHAKARCEVPPKGGTTNLGEKVPPEGGTTNLGRGKGMVSVVG